jgi:hypothetical protein
MERVFAKRNDNTDPTIPPAKPEATEAPLALVQVPKVEAPAGPPLKAGPTSVFMSSPETVYTAMTHMLHALDETRAEEPNWKVVDHHVDEAKRILGDKWAKKAKG